MDVTMFEHYLAQHQLTFQWSGLSKKWWLVETQGGKMQEQSEPQHANSLTEAQSAAYRFVQDRYLPAMEVSSVNSELESLLSKYQLTFNWGDPGLKWWLVGRVNGGNGLGRSTPIAAINRSAAQAAAVEYIKQQYK